MAGTAARSGALHPALDRLRGAARVLLAASAVLVLLAGCGAPAARPSAPAPASASTADGYQELLNRTDAQLAQALTAIGRAPSLAALDQATLAAAGAAGAAAERLTSSGPVVAEVSGDNADLADTLRQFARELAYLAQQIDQHAICAGPTALRAISTAPSLPDLRAAARSLGTPRTDRPAFHWGAALPTPSDEVHHQLANGTRPVDRRGGAPGDGVLRATNAGGTDAVLLLAKGGAVVVSLAVDAGRSAQVDGIPDGDYDLYYTTGQDWDADLGVFARHCAAYRFTTPTGFHTRAVPGGSEYTVQDIDLDTPDAAAGSGAAATDPDGVADPGVPGDDAAPGTAVVDPDRLPR
jgi:hypothetical protein